MLAEASVQDQLVAVQESAPAIRPKYALEGGGFDLSARLVDVRTTHPDLVGIQPDEPQARGDPASRNAIVGTLAAIPAAVTFLCGALARVFPAVRRGLLGAGVALLASSLVARLLVEVAG